MTAWPTKKLGEIYNFPKSIGVISFSHLDSFPNSTLNNWVLLNAEVESKQKIKLRVRALDTKHETFTYLRAKKGRKPKHAEAMKLSEALSLVKGKTIEEIEKLFLLR